METSWQILVVLAQTEGREGKMSDLHIWLALVVGLGFGLGVIGYLIIKKVKAAQETDDEDAPFSLSELRRMFEAGEVALEEYEYMRSNMIAAVKASLGEEIKVETVQPSPSRELPDPPKSNEQTETNEPTEKDGLGHLFDPLDDSAATDSLPDHSVDNADGVKDSKDAEDNEGEDPSSDEIKDEDSDDDGADNPRVQ